MPLNAQYTLGSIPYPERFKAKMNSETLKIETKQTVQHGKDARAMVHASYTNRMRLWARASKRMAVQTIGLLPDGAVRTVTHIVTVTVTGVFTPGLASWIQSHYDLPSTTVLHGICDAGCLGGVRGLALARSIVQAKPNAKVLLLCVEMTSLHNRRLKRTDIGGIIGTLLFADGAACAIIEGTAHRSDSSGLVLLEASTVSIPNTGNEMTWCMGTKAFDMHLGREIPAIIQRHILDAVRTLQLPQDLNEVLWVVHPGGAGILRAVEHGLDLDQDALLLSYDVLRRCGNMSSPTVFYVLRDAIEAVLVSKKDQPSGKKCVVMLGFGPGLTVEAMRLSIPTSFPRAVSDSHRTAGWSHPGERSTEHEVMDTPVDESFEYTRADAVAAYEALNSIQGVVCPVSPIIDAVAQLIAGMDSPQIVDVGCGGGRLAHTLAQRFPQATVVGIDHRHIAIETAQKTNRALPNLRYEPQIRNVDGVFEIPVCDVVTLNGVAHQMGSLDNVAAGLKYANAQAKRGVVVNDLERSWLAALVWPVLSARFHWLFTRDGVVSIQRSFTRSELETVYKTAGISNYRIERAGPFRWNAASSSNDDVQFHQRSTLWSDLVRLWVVSSFATIYWALAGPSSPNQ